MGEAWCFASLLEIYIEGFGSGICSVWVGVFFKENLGIRNECMGRDNPSKCCHIPNRVPNISNLGS